MIGQPQEPIAFLTLTFLLRSFSVQAGNRPLAVLERSCRTVPRLHYQLA